MEGCVGSPFVDGGPISATRKRTISGNRETQPTERERRNAPGGYPILEPTILRDLLKFCINAGFDDFDEFLSAITRERIDRIVYAENMMI